MSSSSKADHPRPNTHAHRVLTHGSPTLLFAAGRNSGLLQIDPPYVYHVVRRLPPGRRNFRLSLLQLNRPP
jgi:hypothetical protein